jgi:hypothetical protein
MPIIIYEGYMGSGMTISAVAWAYKISKYKKKPVKLNLKVPVGRGCLDAYNLL